MQRNTFVVLATLVLSLWLGGCSLFGIATKGDLEQQAKAADSRQQELDRTMTQLRAELAQLGGTLEEVRNQVERSSAQWSADRQRAQTERQALDALIAQLQRRLGETGSAIEELDASVRTEVGGLRGEVTAVQSGVEIVQDELGAVRSQTALADERSVTALRTVYERLLRERQRLSQELDAIERELSSWREMGLIDVDSSSVIR